MKRKSLEHFEEHQMMTKKFNTRTVLPFSEQFEQIQFLRHCQDPHDIAISYNHSCII